MSAEYAYKRATIVEAAAQVFQHNGYERTSVYYYFKGKHELIEAVRQLVNSAEKVREPGPA